MKRNLDEWKEWTARNEAALGDQSERMDRREQLYRGDIRELTPLTARDTERDGSRRKTSHLRNIVAENIESEVSSTIPQPKVTARRKADEGRAKLLEDMIRNELDRLPMEVINDLAERIVPIQGGVYWLVEWDESQQSHSTSGDVSVSLLHPKQVIPQDGVYTAVEDMDAIVVKLPQTRSYIERAYGKKLDEQETEENPEARTLDEDSSTADDMVTQYVAYYRNEKGGIGRFSWVNDTVLEDMEDYEARRVKVCAQCGEPLKADAEVCPFCGSDQAKESVMQDEEIWDEHGIVTAGGMRIPGPIETRDEQDLPSAEPTRLPYYRPDVFPVFLQRNVSLFGQLLGDSDVDKIADQQNTVSRMETKIIDRFIKAGTRLTLPDRADIRIDPEDQEKIYLSSPQDKTMIDVLDFTGDLSQELAYLAQVYEEARQILGITDSFQGRRDATATSGVAKEFAAQQSAGRLESKRVLKEAAYAELFKRIAQLKVAYADEPRPIVATDDRGQAQYEAFDRHDFYEQDPSTGEWICILDDNRFLFSCDTSAPLANNRQQMWSDTTQMLQMGAFGNQQDINTLMLYWTKMELLHYPGASDTKEYLEKIKQEQMEMQQQQMAQQQALQMAQLQAQIQAQQRDAQQRRSDAEQQALIAADQRANQDAWRTAQAMQARQQPPPM